MDNVRKYAINACPSWQKRRGFIISDGDSFDKLIRPKGERYDDTLWLNMVKNIQF